MGNNKYFREALSDFAFDAAFGDSIRHLYESGYTPQQIKEYLNTDSLTIKRIEEVIKKHTGSNCSDSGKESSDDPLNNVCDYEIVKEYDSYGRSSFVKKKKEAAD